MMADEGGSSPEDVKKALLSNATKGSEIVAGASKAIATMYDKAITGLGGQIDKTFKVNDPANTASEELKSLTDGLIKDISERLKKIFPKSE